MGNEGSMPQTEEEFERQAKAPPSAVHPDSVTMPPGQQPQQQQQQQQQAPGNNGRGGRMINAVFHRRQNNNVANKEFHSPAGAPRLEAEDMIMMSPEQQQQYYQDQQEQAMYMQQQQQQQAYAAYPVDPSETTTPAQNNIQPSPGRKGLGFRPSGRAGAAIINSMKNLSLGTGVLSRGNQKSAGVATSAKDWETKWDEDDEDDDEDESDNDVSGNAGHAVVMGKQPIHAQQQYIHASPQPAAQVSPRRTKLNPSPAAARPPMAGPGVGLSSPQPTSMRVAPTSPQRTTLQHVAGDPTVPPTKAHLVTATPEQGAGEDGVEWDTGVVSPESPDYEKPNVQMFLPLLRVLGKGSFGKVVLVQKQAGADKGQLFAMKILRKSHLVRRRQIERTRTERKVLSVANHPFIMKLHYAFQTPDKLYLVLDYCPGGELFFHLSRFRRFPERVARFYAAELLLALGHLHKRGIIYRDLKPENVLLDAEGHVKLGDFGLAKAGIQHACEGAKSMCGTPEYMAPEVLAQQGHGFCVDYWGLGMLVYEMMTGLPPWYTTDRTRLFRRLRSAPLDIPSYFSQPSANCVSALLERNPQRRLGVTGIRAAMEHEFFRSISWRALYGRRVDAPIRPCEGWSHAKDNDGAPPAQMQGDNPDLDAATANFDNTFTRMPVETDDYPEGGNISDSEDLEELHEDTFVGFTFDDKEKDDMAVPQQQQRQRTHNFGGANGNKVQQQQHSTSQVANGPVRHLD